MYAVVVAAGDFHFVGGGSYYDAIQFDRGSRRICGDRKCVGACGFGDQQGPRGGNGHPCDGSTNVHLRQPPSPGTKGMASSHRLARKSIVGITQMLGAYLPQLLRTAGVSAGSFQTRRKLVRRSRTAPSLEVREQDLQLP